MARPKINKTQKILKLLADGKSPNQVAKAVDVSVNYVYSIRWQAKNKKELAKKAKGVSASTGAKRGRPAGSKNASKSNGHSDHSYVPKSPFAPSEAEHLAATLGAQALDPYIKNLREALADLEAARDKFETMQEILDEAEKAAPTPVIQELPELEPAH